MGRYKTILSSLFSVKEQKKKHNNLFDCQGKLFFNTIDSLVKYNKANSEPTLKFNISKVMNNMDYCETQQFVNTRIFTQML